MKATRACRGGVVLKPLRPRPRPLPPPVRPTTPKIIPNSPTSKFSVKKVFGEYNEIRTFILLGSGLVYGYYFLSSFYYKQHQQEKKKTLVKDRAPEKNGHHEARHASTEWKWNENRVERDGSKLVLVQMNISYLCMILIEMSRQKYICILEMMLVYA